MRKFLTIGLVSLIPLTANAGDDNLQLYLGGFSKHFEDKRDNGEDYNEVHNNIGLEYEIEMNETIGKGYYVGGLAQYMENSLENDSILLAGTFKKRWDLDYNWSAGLGFWVGAQTGYPKASEGRDEDEFIPVAYPIAEISYDRFGTWATCVPEIYNSGFCFVGFKVKLF